MLSGEADYLLAFNRPKVLDCQDRIGDVLLVLFLDSILTIALLVTHIFKKTTEFLICNPRIPEAFKTDILVRWHHVWQSNIINS